MGIAEVEKIGDLMIAGKALTGSGNDHDPTGRLRLNDLTDFFELSGIRQRGAAEFNDLEHIARIPFL